MSIIIGTQQPDTLIGVDAADSLFGRDGADFLAGGNGADALFGGDGDDFFYGGAGDDTLFSGAGEDFFFGGSGVDTMTYVAALGPVRLDLQVMANMGGAARGDMFTSVERFRLTGYADVFRGGDAAETVFGGGGGDTLRGGDGNDYLARGRLLDGGAGQDTLQALDLPATLRGGSGDDLLTGGVGDDVLLGGAGRDRMIGGVGRDTVSFADTGAVTINLVQLGASTGAAAGDRMEGIEALWLSNQGDVVVMGASRMAVSGKGGADTLTGGGRADVLSGDAGRDRILAAGGADLLFGGAGFDHLFGGDGNDRIYGGIEVAPGAFPNAVGSASGGNGDDRVYGGNIRDLLTGGAGRDSVYGGIGADTLIGDAGQDNLLGGAGDDLLHGGGEGDTMDGGEGRDTLRYTTMVTYDAGNPALHRGDAAGDVVTSVERLAFLGAGSVYVGGDASITIFASGADLQVQAGAGAEDVFDATGTMAVSFEAAAEGVTFVNDLTALVGGGAAAGDVLVGAREVTLTGFDDVVNLTSIVGRLAFFLADGNDRISLNDPQRLNSGPPSDQGAVFDGGDGDDVLEIVSFQSNARLIGGAGNDTLSSDIFAILPQISGGAGDDVIMAVTSNEAFSRRAVQISGDDGNDAISVRSYYAGISGGSGNDTIAATYYVLGGPNVFVQGNDGDDLITVFTRPIQSGDFPGTTIIVVSGGTGNDTLTGVQHNGQYWASSREHFAFDANSGSDVIFNFDDDTESEGGDDFIVFQNTAASGITDFADLTVTQGAGFTRVSFGTNSIRLEGLAASSFTSEDVLFT